MCHIMFLWLYAHPKCRFLNLGELKPTKDQLWERIDQTGISIAQHTCRNTNKKQRSSSYICANEHFRRYSVIKNLLIKIT